MALHECKHIISTGTKICQPTEGVLCVMLKEMIGNISKKHRKLISGRLIGYTPSYSMIFKQLKKWYNCSSKQTRWLTALLT